MKKCNKCHSLMNASAFHKSVASKDGLRGICKLCRKPKTRKYYQQNKTLLSQKKKESYKKDSEKFSKQSRKYYLNNKEKIIENSSLWQKSNKDHRKKYMKEYQIKNADKLKNYKKQHKNKNIEYKIACNIRSRISAAVKRGKPHSTTKALGCSIEELKKHLESQFQEGMTWNNYGLYGWHIDHIKPLVGFDLTGRQQFLEACHYTNLRPLWAEENLSRKKK